MSGRAEGGGASGASALKPGVFRAASWSCKGSGLSEVEADGTMKRGRLADIGVPVVLVLVFNTEEARAAAEFVCAIAASPDALALDMVAAKAFVGANIDENGRGVLNEGSATCLLPDGLDLGVGFAREAKREAVEVCGL